MRKNMFFFAVVSFFILTTLLLGSCTDFDADVMAAAAPEKPEIPEEDEEFIEWTYAFSEGISAETVLDSIQGEDGLNYFVDYVITINDKYEATYMGQTSYKDSVRTIKLSEVTDAAFRNLDIMVTKGYTYYQKNDEKYVSFTFSNEKVETEQGFEASGWYVQKNEKSLTLNYNNSYSVEDTLKVNTTSAGFSGMFTDPQSGLSVDLQPVTVGVTQDYWLFHSKDNSFIYDEESARWEDRSWSDDRTLDKQHNTVMRNGTEYLRYPFFSWVNFIIRVDGEEVARPNRSAEFDYYIPYNAAEDVANGDADWRA